MNINLSFITESVKKILPKKHGAPKAPKKANANRRVKNPRSVLRMAILALILLAFSVEFIFAVSIYIFKSDSALTKKVASVIPYPAAFTTAGIVTVNQYWEEKDYIEHFYASTKQESVNSDDLSTQILTQEAENQIIQKEAIKYKIKVSNTDVDAAMDEIFANNGGQAEVEKALQDLYGLDVASFKKLVRTQLLRDEINKQVIKHVTAKHILIRVEDGATQEKIDEAKARIDGYLQEINSGAISFEEAAKKYSEDIGSNEDGGSLEPFARGDMVKEFEDVAFATSPGQTSEPFMTSFGWHIVRVESATGYVDKNFDQWLDDLMKANLFIELYRDNG